ncbi:MAG: CinA family protein [Beduini sp.]|uniref:CinA family protein n=1 Tax=Beduini sp. TaxID=1922300 RepID=UPI0011C960E1
MRELIDKLIEKKLTIASCESFTVGQFGAGLGSVSGASNTYKGTLVTYQTMIKTDVLKVSRQLVKEYGVVSEAIAKEMCLKGKTYFTSDICVSFTGNAGPEAMENKPVGLIYIGINFLDKITTYEYHLVGSRAMIQKQAVHIAKKKLLDMLG